MNADAVEVTSVLPVAHGPERRVRFFPEHSAPHPLWFGIGFPDLEELHLPAELATRLKGWAAYWDTTFHWDTGWPIGAPARWWSEEQDALPRDVALAFGSDFVVKAGGCYLHSTSGAEPPPTTAAMHALIRADADERARIAADIANGARYTAVAGHSNYAHWLEVQHRDG